MPARAVECAALKGPKWAKRKRTNRSIRWSRPRATSTRPRSVEPIDTYPLLEVDLERRRPAAGPGPEPEPQRDPSPSRNPNPGTPRNRQGEMSKLCSAEQAVNHVNSNQRVFVHGGVATPTALVDALVQEASRLHNVELIHLHTSGDAAYGKPEYARSFRVANLFVGHNMRHQLDGDPASTTCRAFFRKSRSCSAPDAGHSTWPWFKSRRPTSAATAASASR